MSVTGVEAVDAASVENTLNRKGAIIIRRNRSSRNRFARAPRAAGPGVVLGTLHFSQLYILVHYPRAVHYAVASF